MKNLKFKSKIFITFSLIIIFTIIFSVNILSKINVLKTTWDINKKLTTIQEMRNSINACGINIRDLSIEKDKKTIDTKKGWINESVTKYSKMSEEIQNGMSSKNDNNIVSSLNKESDIYFEHVKNILNMKDITKITNSEKKTFILEEKNLFNSLDKFVAQELENDSSAVSESEGNIKIIMNMLIALIIGQVIIGIISTFILKKNLIQPIQKVIHNLKIVSEGDFTKNISDKFVNRKDEIGDLAKAVNSMQKELIDLIGEILDDSRNLGLSSINLSKTVEDMNTKLNEVNSSTSTIINGVQETSASAEEITASIEEIDSSVNELSMKALDGSNNSSEFKKRALIVQNESKSAIGKVENMYGEKKKKILEAIENIKIVDNIEIMADTIANISEQTNLLALNAAIEAARAGEQGKGFAVVAKGIRELSEESSKAVSDIKDTIQKVKDAFENLSCNSSEILKFINGEVNPQFDSFIKMGNDYYNDAQYVSEMSEDLASMTEEINATINQVSEAVQMMAEISQKSSENTDGINISVKGISKKMREVENAVESQNELSRRLNDLVANFKIDSSKTE